jgi:hypothetical protein
MAPLFGATAVAVELSVKEAFEIGVTPWLVPR